MTDEYGRQAYVRDYDPSDVVAETKALIAEHRAEAEARAKAVKHTDLEDPDAA